MTTKKTSNDHELPDGLAAGWRADAIRKGQRPEEFWGNQRTRIRGRITSQRTRKRRSLWLSAATAAALFLVVLLIAPARPRPQKTPPRATLDADQELLLAVERSLSAGTPEALEPLTLLVESSAGNNEAESISHKEHGHEN